MACSKEMPVSLTTCSICFETFKVPRSLPCLHTFCEECLTKYIASVLSKSEAPKGSFQCPICRCVIQQPEGIDEEDWGKSFPLNHLMISIMDFESVKEGRLCNSCKRENETESATNWCVECSDPLCENCTKWHKRFRNSENHRIIPIVEFDQRSFSSYMTMKCSKHPERAIEAFCSDHSVQCCLSCVTLDHRKCEDVGTVEAAAEKLRNSNCLQNLEEDLSQIQEKLKSLANEKGKNIEELKTTSMNIKAEIISARKEIDSRLDKIQTETLNDLSKIEQSTVPDLEIEKDEIECQQSVASSGLTILRTGLNYASDAQLLDEAAKIKEAKLKLEGYISQWHLSRSHVRILYSTPKEFMDKRSQVELFGRISSSKLMHKSLENVDPLKRPVKRVSEFNTSSENYFTGAEILSNGQFLLAHYCAKALEMYDPKGHLLSKLSFIGKPWCVDMIEQSYGVLTVYNEKILVFFSISDENKLVEIKRKSFKNFCYDVRYCDKKLYIACRKEIMILDAEGTSIRNIGPLSSDARFLDIDTVSSTICYTSNICHILTCIDMEGSEIFKYKSDELSESSSISRDSAGNIYVVGYSSGNIHQLDRNGKFNRIVVSGLSDSHALRFQKHSKKFITNSRGKAIVYEFVEE